MDAEQSFSPHLGNTRSESPDAKQVIAEEDGEGDGALGSA